jgi:SAM-dependent methyltransferase
MPNAIHSALHAVRQAGKYSDNDHLRSAETDLQSLVGLERPAESALRIGIKEWILESFRTLLADNGIQSGVIAEIGGSKKTFLRGLHGFELRFLSIYPPKDADPEYIVADITSCPHLPDESFDAIFSVSVFEHLAQPWNAAREITRILKPGGISFHVAPFSYFYHEAPIDYWRFSPDALAALFDELDPVMCEFYTANRRRDNRGSQANPIDGYGGEKFKVDPIGGWRENVHSAYAGRKTAEGKERKMARLRNQLIVDAVRAMVDRGLRDAAACRAAPELLNRVDVAEDGKLTLVSREGPGVEQITDIWTRRGKLGIKPTHNRYVIPAMVGGINKAWEAGRDSSIVRPVSFPDVQEESSMPNAPRTMTRLGLAFLEALASRNEYGSFLEIGPLFGSSTQAIAAGRKIDEPIHTIDTFEPAPWVRRRFGFDLSRELFDEFTGSINNLVVHQGLAPDIVKDSWQDRIGFYFDDATHGDPGWTNNFEFFSQFFGETTIICGDDFASGWPDIVNNVYDIAVSGKLTLYVIGRVWALTHKKEERIVEAINEVCPKLKGVYINSLHGGQERRNSAACWTWGLHRPVPMRSFQIEADRPLGGEIVTFSNGKLKQVAKVGTDWVDLQGVEQLYFGFKNDITCQLCLADERGKTKNTKAYRSRQTFDIPPGRQIVAVRLSDA